MGQCRGPHHSLDIVVVFLPFLALPLLMSDKLFPANLRWSKCGRTIPRGRNTAQALPHVPEKSEVLAGNTYWDNKIVRKAGPLRGHAEENIQREGGPMVALNGQTKSKIHNTNAKSTARIQKAICGFVLWLFIFVLWHFCLCCDFCVRVWLIFVLLLFILMLLLFLFVLWLLHLCCGFSYPCCGFSYLCCCFLHHGVVAFQIRVVASCIRVVTFAVVLWISHLDRPFVATAGFTLGLLLKQNMFFV